MLALEIDQALQGGQTAAASVRLPTDQDIWARAPTWSSDGTRLAYSGNVRGEDSLYVVSALGTEQIQMTRNDPNTGGPFYGVLKASWRPDAEAVLLTNAGALVVVGMNDMAPVVILGQPLQGVVPDPGAPLLPPVAPGPAFVEAAQWLADGRIALFGDEGWWIANGDGSSAERIGSLPDLTMAAPAWSADGGTVVFQTRTPRPEGPEPAQWDLFALSTGETKPRKLTDSPANEVHPTWSPDGTRLAFATDRDGQFEIYTMALDGSDALRLTYSSEQAIANCWPAWAKVADSVALRPTPSLEPGATPGPLTFYRGRLEPGAYVTNDFTPRLSFRLGEGWEGYLSDPDKVVFQDREDRFIEVSIAKLQAALDPVCAETFQSQLIGGSPRDIIDWLRARKELDVTEPQPINLSGVAGLQVELEGRGTAGELCPSDMTKRLHLFVVGNDTVWVRDGQRLRVIALDVRGTTVTILAGGPKANFREVMQRLQPIIDSLRFE